MSICSGLSLTLVFLIRMDGWVNFFPQHSLPEICYCHAVLQAQDWPAARNFLACIYARENVLCDPSSSPSSCLLPSTGIFMENRKRFRHLQNACGM
jgi:hypothetical protein